MGGSVAMTRRASSDGVHRAACASAAQQVTEVASQHHQVELDRPADQGKRLVRSIQPAGGQDLLAEREQGGAGLVVRAAAPLQPDRKAQFDGQVAGPGIHPAELGQPAQSGGPELGTRGSCHAPQCAERLYHGGGSPLDW